LTPSKQIAIVGDDAQELLGVMFEQYRPNQIVAMKRAEAESAMPLLENRVELNDKATAYVCEHFGCRMHWRRGWGSSRSWAPDFSQIP
jgi:hypothetical protein